MTKAVGGFRDHLCDPDTEDTNPCADNVDDRALIYATASFFGGVLITYLLDLVVHQLMHCLPGGERGDGKSKPADSAASFEHVVQVSD